MGGGGATMKSDAGRTASDRVVMHTRQAAYRTYVISLPVPKGAIPRALYRDTEDPYHYVRLHGSRFAPDNHVVNGPARDALSPITE